MTGKGNVDFLMELHSDPEWHHEGESPYATLWRTELWKGFKSVAGMSSTFYMGGLGHKAIRPTTVATNYPTISQLDGLCDFNEGCVPASLLTRKDMRTWPTFKHLVMEAIVDFHDGLRRRSWSWG